MPFKLSIADSTDATITGTRSTGACNTLLPADVVISVPVLAANNTIVASTGATNTVALVLTPVLPALVLLAANTGVASTSASNN